MNKSLVGLGSAAEVLVGDDVCLQKKAHGQHLKLHGSRLGISRGSDDLDGLMCFLNLADSANP